MPLDLDSTPRDLDSESRLWTLHRRPVEEDDYDNYRHREVFSGIDEEEEVW